MTSKVLQFFKLNEKTYEEFLIVRMFFINIRLGKKSIFMRIRKLNQKMIQ